MNVSGGINSDGGMLSLVSMRLGTDFKTALQKLEQFPQDEKDIMEHYYQKNMNLLSMLVIHEKNFAAVFDLIGILSRDNLRVLCDDTHILSELIYQNQPELLETLYDYFKDDQGKIPRAKSGFLEGEPPTYEATTDIETLRMVHKLGGEVIGSNGRYMVVNRIGHIEYSLDFMKVFFELYPDAITVDALERAIAYKDHLPLINLIISLMKTKNIKINRDEWLQITKLAKGTYLRWIKKQSGLSWAEIAGSANPKYLKWIEKQSALSDKQLSASS